MYDKMKTNFVEINNIYNRINEIIKNHNEIIKNYNKINNKINNTEKFKKSGRFETRNSGKFERGEL